MHVDPESWDEETPEFSGCANSLTSLKRGFGVNNLGDSEESAASASETMPSRSRDFAQSTRWRRNHWCGGSPVVSRTSARSAGRRCRTPRPSGSAEAPRADAPSLARRYCRNSSRDAMWAVTASTTWSRKRGCAVPDAQMRVPAPTAGGTQRGPPAQWRSRNADPRCGRAFFLRER
jgi:hypothetical protein